MCQHSFAKKLQSQTASRKSCLLHDGEIDPRSSCIRDLSTLTVFFMQSFSLTKNHLGIDRRIFKSFQVFVVLARNLLTFRITQTKKNHFYSYTIKTNPNLLATCNWLIGWHVYQEILVVEHSLKQCYTFLCIKLLQSVSQNLSSKL